MAVLPKSKGPLTTRKKAVRKTVTEAKESVVKLEVPAELPKLEQKLKPWQSAPNTSMELFGCCSSHKECTAYGDCVEKAFHVNYAKVCSLYKKLKKGGINHG